MKKTLVILTRDEIEGLRKIFPQILLSSVDEVFAVDYQSNDGTKEFFLEKGIKIIDQEKPGRGEAFRLAFQKTKGDVLVFFSPDGNENPADIPKIFKKLSQGYDMVIASRFLTGGKNEEEEKIFKWRLWANRVFTFLANFFWNRGKPYITDTINGFRGITRQAFNKMKPDAPGYVIEYQMTIRGMRLGLKIGEIPTIEGQRIGGESKAKSLPTGFLFLKYFLREL